MTTATTINDFLNNARRWRNELEKLRAICLDCNLLEEVKWGQPCYTLNGNNVVIIGELKDHCTLSFFKGALLYDAEHILLTPGEHTQSGRWIKFSSVEEIAKMEPVLKAYIYEAIEVEKAGLKVGLKTTAEYPMPEELQHKLNEFPPLKTAFNALTPGRQKAYILHCAQPKQAQTREARVDKCIPLILSGKGINDDALAKYKSEKNK